MEPLTEQEAIVGVALCAAYADGTMGHEEDERLTDHLLACRALRGLGEPGLRAAMQKADRLARAEGDGALLAHAASVLRPEWRETAFVLGADLVLADDEVAREEHAFVERLRKSLGVEPQLAKQVVEVLRIWNRA